MNIPLLRPANDNLPLKAEFRNLPEAFVQAYGKEIFGWAARLQQVGQFLTVKLWNRPNANLLSSDYWPEVKLRCDLMVDQGKTAMLMVVQPDGEKDDEIVRKHTEALPSIMAAHRAAAAADRNTPRSRVKWVFDKTVPDYFAHRYATELRAWAANLKKIGLIKHIVLREGYLSDLSPNEEQGAVLLRVALKAVIERKAGDELEIVVSASTEQDERLIRKHCEKMQKAGIPAGVVLVEPERPGIPILPNITPT